MKKRVIVQYRRKREGKTDYRLRLKLLLSHQHRLVIRKSNKHMVVQVTKFTAKGDVIVASAKSSELTKLGWTKNTGNIPAAYLTGMLAGAKAKKAGVKTAVVDFGLQQIVKGSRLYAAVKGAVDGGLEMKVGEGVLPSQDRLFGAHIKISKADIEAIKAKIKG